MYGIAIALTVVLGLASRMHSLGLPVLVLSNGGDVLSATCIFFGVRWVWWRATLIRGAMIAYLICTLIECQQLFQAPWAVRFRENRIVGTLLGHGFLWIDLVRYFVGVVIGIAIAVAVDRRLARPRPGRR